MSNYFIQCKKADFHHIAERFRISPYLARILRNRDLTTDEEIEEYLFGGTDRLNDPFLLKGMEEAVPLLFDAVQKGEKIRIIGDYDCDGVCSSYILRTYLSFLGADADIRLPHRIREGYGMNPKMAGEAKRDGVGLILTCDNGVSSYEAVREAKKAGISVIISDHHEVPLPLVEADALIDAKQPEDTYPYKELCGAGIAYKIVSALHIALCGKASVKAPDRFDETQKKDSEALLDSLLVYAAIATIADVVPLNGENRILAKEGLKRLKETKNEGLLAIMRERGIEAKDLSGYHVGFIIAPCINSAGRLKSADIVLDLFDADREKAEKIAADLSALNEERKRLNSEQAAIAEKILNERQEKEGALPKVLVLSLPDAHESIIGIVASKLKEEYERPVIICTETEEGFKGSGRSVDSWNMIEGLRALSELFQKLGGHAKAAGFTLKEGVTPEDLERELLLDFSLTENDLAEKKWIDMELPFAYATEEFARELSVLEPCGLGNEAALFAQRDVSVNRAFIVGKNNNVLRLLLTDKIGYHIEAVCFSSEEKTQSLFSAIERGKQEKEDQYRISFVYTISVNEFRGEKTVQLIIRDFIQI